MTREDARPLPAAERRRAVPSRAARRTKEDAIRNVSGDMSQGEVPSARDAVGVAPRGKARVP